MLAHQEPRAEPAPPPDDPEAGDPRTRELLQRVIVAVCAAFGVDDKEARPAARPLPDTDWETLPSCRQTPRMRWRRYREHLCMVRQVPTRLGYGWVATVDGCPVYPPPRHQIADDLPGICIREDETRALAETYAACWAGDEFPKDDWWFVSAANAPSKDFDNDE